MQWAELVAADPEVIVVAPCGYRPATRCLEELPLLQAKPGWAEIAAVRNGRVYFADGNAYFNRPGPRLADSAEMLARDAASGEPARKPRGDAWVRHEHAGCGRVRLTACDAREAFAASASRPRVAAAAGADAQATSAP